MVATRSSQESTSPSSNTKGTKRAGEKISSPSSKRSKSDGKTKQKTIEETLNNGKDEDEVEDEDDGPDEEEEQTNGKSDQAEDANGDDLKEAEEAPPEAKKQANGDENKTKEKEEKKQVQGDDQETSNGEKNAFDEVKADTNDVKQSAQKEQDEKSKDINKDNNSIIEDSKREAQVPSTVLEKGIIYFFFRGRVGTDEPQGLQDIARSYLVLRPLPLGAVIGDGPLEDKGNSRLIALPKKMLPKSGRDRFLVFVEKAGTSIKDLRDQFQGTEYATKTSGTSQVPAATPFAEGVYAITSSGADSHLAYHVTVPSEIGEVQKELGLNEKGSYNISLKNPEAPSPAYATIGNPAKYSKDIQDQFRGRRWMPVIPEALEYEGSQFLLIGEGVDKALEIDGKKEEEKPADEMERLEEEDHERVENLKEDDPVFADLGLSSKQYPHLQTTW